MRSYRRLQSSTTSTSAPTCPDVGDGDTRDAVGVRARSQTPPIEKENTPDAAAARLERRDKRVRRDAVDVINALARDAADAPAVGGLPAALREEHRVAQDHLEQHGRRDRPIVQK